MRWKRTLIKPKLCSDDFLKTLPKSYIAQLKLDGWRVLVETHKQIMVYTKNGNKINISPELIDEIRKNVPPNSSIDCEYVNSTRIKSLNKQFGWRLPLVNFIAIIDNLIVDNVNMSNIDYKDRISINYSKKLETPSIDDLSILNVDNKIINFPTSNDCISLYNLSKSMQISEGVVVKNGHSKIQSVWYKTKYRD